MLDWVHIQYFYIMEIRIKNPEKLHQVITAKFSKEWGESQSRYLITGHFHHEKSLSFAGLTWYQVAKPKQAI